MVLRPSQSRLSGFGLRVYWSLALRQAKKATTAEQRGRGTEAGWVRILVPTRRPQRGACYSRSPGKHPERWDAAHADRILETQVSSMAVPKTQPRRGSESHEKTPMATYKKSYAAFSTCANINLPSLYADNLVKDSYGSTKNETPYSHRSPKGDRNLICYPQP